VTTDCGWPSRDRTSTGEITWNATLFPSGFPALGAYLHDRDLQFGVYSGAGVWECDVVGGTTHLQASLGNEVIDAQTFADWGADALKYDNCWSTGSFVDYTPQANTSDRFQTMADALDGVDRDIVYAICEWGVGWNVGDWGSAYADSWRVSNDIQNNWASIWRITNEVVPYTKYSGVGRYPDMDMLIVGLKVLSEEEERFHFSMWAISKSPLIVGAPMDDSITPSYSLDILSNAEVIALNQDPLGEQAQLVRRYTEEEYDVWAANLSDSRFLVAVTNWANSSASVKLDLLDLVGLEEAANARDIWAKEEIGAIDKSDPSLDVELAGHEAKLFVFSNASLTSPPWQTVASTYYSAADAILSGDATVVDCTTNPSPHSCAPTMSKVRNMTAGSSILFHNVSAASTANSSATMIGIDYM
jgi:alpha-galactosidase